MYSRSVHIIIIHKTEVVLRGLYSIFGEAGVEAIAVKSIEDLKDYPHLSGYILVVATNDIIQNVESVLPLIYNNAKKISYLEFCTHKSGETVININDSIDEIHRKLKCTTDALAGEQNEQNSPELTPREVDVLKLVALGYTNKEIANALFISTHTVISHRKNISEKLGIKTISGLTMYAVIKQIIELKDLNTKNLK